MPSDGEWSEYAKQVLAELKRHDKWLDSLDKKMDNHITHIEHRLTQIETSLKGIKDCSEEIVELKTTLKNMKWITGLLLVSVLSIFGMIFVQMVM